MAQIACVGAGQVGSAWAALFAHHGHDVCIFDVDRRSVETRALPMIAEVLSDLGSEQNALSRIRVVDSIPEAVREASYVQESVREDLETKTHIAAEIDAAAPDDCIIGSSTSAIPGSRFLTGIPGEARALVVHPVNPPSHIPFVELCATGATSQETIDRARDFMTSLGMKPAVLRREIDGFLLNRLQYTLVAEAMHLVGEGYCDAEDIDTVIRDGLAMRWAFMGPFMTAHLNAAEGFQGFVDGLGPMMRRMGQDARTDYAWTAEQASAIHAQLAANVPVDEIPAAQRERNTNILKLRKLRGDITDTD